MVNGFSLENTNYEEVLSLVDNEKKFNKITANNQDYVITKDSLEQQQQRKSNDILLYYDAPAINSELESVILKINDEEIKNAEVLRQELLKYSPGDKITLNVLGEDKEDYNKDIILGKNPGNKSLPWLGIGFSSQEPRGILGNIFSKLNFREPNVYYKENFNAGPFIYDLLWWLVLISITVALINMLPVGIFDGGRFFYLTVWGLTRNEKIARKSFAFSTYFILSLLLLVMFRWAWVLFS